MSDLKIDNWKLNESCKLIIENLGNQRVNNPSTMLRVKLNRLI